MGAFIALDDQDAGRLGAVVVDAVRAGWPARQATTSPGASSRSSPSPPVRVGRPDHLLVGAKGYARYMPSGAPDSPSRRAGASERYEAMPGIAALPAWLWRRLPRAGRVVVALIPIAVVALVLALGPGIDESKRERAQAEAERLAQLRAERTARIEAEQRPRFRRGEPAGTSLARRAALVDALPAAVAADARARVAAGSLDGPIRLVRCEPFPRSVDGGGAHLDPSLRTGRYSCLAVTSRTEATEQSAAVVIGHPYRIEVDFETGRYALCKVAGRPGEGALATQSFVPVPPACGG